MQLSVEVKRQGGTSVYLCRGKVVYGTASDYLFDLLTRSQDQDVIVDVAQVIAFDDAGLRALALSCQLLASLRRRFLLRHAPSIIVERLHTEYGAPVVEWPIVHPATLAAAVSNRSSR